MGDKKYILKYTYKDGSYKEAVFTAPLGEKGISININLLDGTNFVVNSDKWYLYGTIVDSGALGQKSSYYNNSKNSSDSILMKELIYYGAGIKRVSEGSYYTLSFWTKGSGKLKVFIGDSESNIVDYSTTIICDGTIDSAHKINWDLTDSFQHHYITFKTLDTIDKSDYKYIYFIVDSKSSAYVSAAKLEAGKEYTSWCLSEADKVFSVKIGTTTTGNAGTNATITNSGTDQNMILNFTIPKGSDGKVLDTLLFIYKTTSTLNSLITPTENTEWGVAPSGWFTTPVGVSLDNKYEYLCYRTRDSSGNKSSWVGPVIFSTFGVDGKGIEYIYNSVGNAVTDDPSLWAINQLDDYILSGDTSWTTTLPNKLAAGTVVYISCRKKVEGKWGSYSKPSVWSYFPKDGEEGTYIDITTTNIGIPLKSDYTTYSTTQSFTISCYKNGGIQNLSVVSVDSDKTSPFLRDFATNNISYNLENNKEIVTLTILENSTLFKTEKSGSITFCIILDGGQTFYRSILLTANIGGIQGKSGDYYTINVSPSVITEGANEVGVFKYNAESIVVKAYKNGSVLDFDSDLSLLNSYFFGYKYPIGDTYSDLLRVPYHDNLPKEKANTILNIKDKLTKIGDLILFFLYDRTSILDPDKLEEYLELGTLEEHLKDHIIISYSVPFIMDGTVTGIASYRIDIIGSNISYNSTGGAGSILFKIYRTDSINGNNSGYLTSEKITELGLDVQFSIYEDNTVRSNPDITSSADPLDTNKSLIYSYNNYSAKTGILILFKNTNIVLATIVVPVALSGKDAQTLTLAILRVSAYDANTTYYDGTISDGSGFKYKDVVSWEGKYYLYVGTTDIHKISGVSPTPKDSETLNAGWQIYDGGLFGDLIANYIFAKSISANLVVILDKDSKVVTGMTGEESTISRGTIIGNNESTASATPYNIETTDNKGSIRIFAGTPSSLNLYDCPYYVTDTGYLKATNADITGVINATSGKFSGTVEATDGIFNGYLKSSLYLKYFPTLPALSKTIYNNLFYKFHFIGAGTDTTNSNILDNLKLNLYIYYNNGSTGLKDLYICLPNDYEFIGSRILITTSPMTITSSKTIISNSYSVHICTGRHFTKHAYIVGTSDNSSYLTLNKLFSIDNKYEIDNISINHFNNYFIGKTAEEDSAIYYPNELILSNGYIELLGIPTINPNAYIFPYAINTDNYGRLISKYIDPTDNKAYDEFDLSDNGKEIGTGTIYLVSDPNNSDYLYTKYKEYLEDGKTTDIPNSGGITIDRALTFSSTKTKYYYKDGKQEFTYSKPLLKTPLCLWMITNVLGTFTCNSNYYPLS